MLSLGTLLAEEHTQTHTTHSGASRLTHPYKYIFPPPVYVLPAATFITLND